MSQDYNATIHLPKTEFPMRGNLPKREPAMLEAWNQMDLYNEMLKKNEGKPLFCLHDGPPFSNGDIHMGHALNKSLKDFIVRSYAMRGYYTPYVPGWDNHGMPIESAIIKKNKLNHKAMSIADFRSACHQFADDFIYRQMAGFKRIGILGDWEHPYKTMDKEFEAEEVKIFGEMFKKGYIYKGLKPVYWCPKDETALAEAEIEYADDPCTSIYVKFAVKDDQGKLEAFGGKANTYFIIWTTTTWTLPGNLAIALNPSETYVLVQAPNGERYIVAEALCAKTMAQGNVENYEIITTMSGRDFEYMTAQHPFLDRESLLVNADYVTMDSGTGCVHTAPGFGADDYITCRRYKMDLIVPVDDRGYQTADAGKFAGMYYEESNKAILTDMTETGALFASERFTHSYPHCWRCKSPIIFRATPQWFCSVESFKEDAVAACEEVMWLPAWGKERMISMIRERADWCISRQRRWGLPIPVFYCEDCGKPVCDDATITAVSELFGAEGSNAWFEKEAGDILPATYKCPHCGGTHFAKETDTLDGWFDSGSTHYASMQKDQDIWPATMYIEGADQYRGWFQSSMLTAVAALGKGAPFKECLTHGWTVDGEGKAMHKSLGNGVDPNEIINQFGSDLLRLWAASSDYHSDMRCSKDIFKQLSQNYLKIRNTSRYILGNLFDFQPDMAVDFADMLELDQWAMMKYNNLVAKVRKAYDNYEFHIVFYAIHDFCVIDMSNFYLDVIKDRLYCDATESVSRRSAQTAIYNILKGITLLLAPILCFTGDEVWKAMPHTADEDLRNVVLNEMPNATDAYAFDDAKMAKWDAMLALRTEVNRALEAARTEKVIGKPLEAIVTVYAKASAMEQLTAMQPAMADLCIVSGFVVTEGEGAGMASETFDGISIAVARAEGERCERCWIHADSIGSDANHPTLCARCAAALGE